MKRKIPDPGIPKKGIKKAAKKVTKASRYAKQFENYRKALELFGEIVNRPKDIRKRTIQSLKKRWAKIRKASGITLRDAVKAATPEASSPKKTSRKPVQPYEEFSNWNGFEEIYDNLMETLEELRGRYYNSGHVKQNAETQAAVDRVIQMIRDLENQYGKEAVGMAIDKAGEASAIIDQLDAVPYGYEEDYMNDLSNEIAAEIERVIQYTF